MTAIESDVVTLVRAMAPATADTAPVPGEPALEDTFAGLGYTSLRFMELTIAVERAFGLAALNPESLAGVVTVGDLVNLVRAQLERS